ncbi:similar to modification methylase [Plenodomus lingam JN3]|uniref:Similar to modification methylase n=1 Tax=Leptosphaeria maculans (strain JN3 / isolate v23.1.3 / race Av1-4-5-6-7-8) TaxID=985895 RepID=E4ZMS8_LEPMJ|nr:similar to modification methylase [Plenodomus lingam JN3]CBX92531.1 similar to modification methylase [Plenodomus lingam JN3]
MIDMAAFRALSEHLAQGGYAFVCPSPETQGRVFQKRISDAETREAKSAQDFFGWNLQCTREGLASFIPDDLFDILEKATIIKKVDDGRNYSSRIRVSNFYLPNLPCGEPDTTNLYYIHSAFPASADSVFFGPDTYLFVPFLGSALRHLSQPPTSIIDVCCGSGAGAIHLARQYPQAQVLGLDLNPCALELGAVNAQLADVNVDFMQSNLFHAVPHALTSNGIDLIVSNPPYIASSENGQDLPIYADGGAGHGLDLSIRIIHEGIKILSSRGVIIVYTGVAIPTANPGHDAFLTELKGVKDARVVEYRILHPDMWSEEIGKGAYADVCRIQVVGAVLKRNT